MTAPNGMTTAYAYDNWNRLTNIEHKDGETVLESYAYDLDDMSNILGITHADGSYWAYEYDARYRLTTAERSASGDTLLKRWTYTYSLADNMTTKEVYTPPSTTDTYVYAYNTANELVSQTLGGTETDFAYDAWGRMTSKTQGDYSATYAYRYGSKLYTVASDFPGEGTVTYNYDGLGRRRRAAVSGGAITTYRYDAGLLASG